MQMIIQFIKEIYLTGFAIIFRHARVKQVGYKAGSAITIIALIEGFIVIGILANLEIFFGGKVFLSKPQIVVIYFTLVLLNLYILLIRGHGIKFAHNFDNLKKTRKTSLIVSCFFIAVSATMFFIYSAISFRHYVGAN
jgi:hypothetical protein